MNSFIDTTITCSENFNLALFKYLFPNQNIWGSLTLSDYRSACDKHNGNYVSTIPPCEGLRRTDSIANYNTLAMCLKEINNLLYIFMFINGYDFNYFHWLFHPGLDWSSITIDSFVEKASHFKLLDEYKAYEKLRVVNPDVWKILYGNDSIPIEYIVQFYIEDDWQFITEQQLRDDYRNYINGCRK